MFTEQSSPDGNSRQFRLSGMRLWQVAVPMVLFAVLVALIVPRHEAWADEAQSWELSTTLGVVPMFTRWLHYEMTPGLWHIMIHGLAALGLSFGELHWLTAAIESAAVFVLLWRSPFPWYLRVLLPFGFFLAFQYAIVARSYSLVPLLLFLLAAIWRHRRLERLTLVGLLLLLANTCAQALMIVMGLTVVLLIEARKDRRWRQPDFARWILSFGLLAVGIGFAVWCCRPPADAPWVVAMHAWSHSGHYASNGAPVPEWQRVKMLAEMALFMKLDQFRTVALGGISGLHIWSVLVWAALLLNLWKQKMLRYLWPAIFLLAFGTFSRFSPYHQGLVWVLLLFLAWVSWPEGLKLERWCMISAFCACAVVQIYWTVQCVPREWHEPYAPAAPAVPTLAMYVARGTPVDVLMPPPLTDGITPPAFFEVGMQPYFGAQPFANIHTRYWSWLPDAQAREQFLRDTEQRRAVVFAVDYLDREAKDIERLHGLGYRMRSKFCAQNIYPRAFRADHLCYEFLEPPASSGENETAR